MECTFHSTGLTAIGGNKPAKHDAIYHNNDDAVYAVASSASPAHGVPTPAHLFLQTVVRNAELLLQIWDAPDGQALKIKLEKTMSLLFRKASSIIRKVHGVAEGQTGALASGSVLMLKGDQAILGYVGQTGAFLIRGTVVTALNRDHTGDAMGQIQPLTPGVAHFKTAGDDYLVLLSEGSQETVSKSELKDIADMADSTDDFAQTMVNLASRRTEKDVSCVIIDIERTDEPEAAPTEGEPGEPAASAETAGADEAAENHTEASAEPKADEEPLGDVEGHIKRYELFQGIPAEQVERMIAQLSEMPLERGHVLYEEGAPMTQLYLVTRGQIQLKRRGGQAQEVGPGVFLCETALLQAMVQTESALAQTPATVLSLSQMALAQLTVTDPQFGVRLYHNLARLMALRLIEKS